MWRIIHLLIKLVSPADHDSLNGTLLIQIYFLCEYIMISQLKHLRNPYTVA